MPPWPSGWEMAARYADLSGALPASTGASVGELPASERNELAAISTSERIRRATGAPRRTLAVVKSLPFANLDTVAAAIVSEKLIRRRTESRPDSSPWQQRGVAILTVALQGGPQASRKELRSR